MTTKVPTDMLADVTSKILTTSSATDEGDVVQLDGDGKIRPALLTTGTLAQGDVLYYDGSDLVNLGAGTSGQFLKTQGADANPVWATVTDNGKILQVVNVMDGAVATGTTVMVNDDTISQNTEGNEWMTLAITPTSATSKLLIQVVCYMDADADDQQVMASLFQDDTAGALASAHIESGSGAQLNGLVFNHYMTSGTTSETTFKVRGGQNSAGTVTFNGSASGRLQGGVMASSITIMEIGA